MKWLEEIEMRSNLAQVGPWHIGHVNQEFHNRMDVDGPLGTIAEEVDEKDARFIMHARSDIPLLCARLRMAMDVLNEISNITLHKHSDFDGLLKYFAIIARSARDEITRNPDKK